MSHTTSRFRAGSVLMEFMLVLPVYLLLMGMAFSLGEMGAKAISLAHGDRVLSHSVDGSAAGALPSLMRSLMFPQDMIAYGDDISLSAMQDDIRNAKNTYRADEGFKCAWSWQTAGKAGDDYALPPWTRGWLQYPHAHYSSTTGDSSGADDGAFGDLLPVGSLGRTLIESKETEGRIRVYNYYTLKRTALGAKGYRRWKGPALLRTAGFTGGPNWNEKVYREKYADADGAKLDAASQGADSEPSEPWGAEHDRSTQMMIWSQ